MRYLPLLCLLGCATLKQDFKPLPSQTEACARAQLTISNAITAAQCLQLSDPKSAETCWESWGSGLGLGFLQCEAIALWQDLHHAQTVSQSTGIPTVALQASAKAYLQAKAPTNP